MSLPFYENSKALTLGVELEFQVLDQSSLLLTPRAAEILKQSGNPKLIHEFFQSTIEVVSDVCADVQEVVRDLTASIHELTEVGHGLGLRFSGTGTHPLADYRERLVTEVPRYSTLIDRNQWLIRRMAVYGMHIHLGMKSGDDSIRFGNFFLNFVPHLIGLSASSPFWQKMDTGLASCRPTMYEALPTAGMPYIVKSWKEFEKLFRFLKRTNAVQSMKDLWWDLRPSPSFGTIEIRICDGPATQRETFSIVAFVHALAHWFSDHKDEWVKTHAPIRRWIFRENKWRAIRYGLDATVIVGRAGTTTALRDDIEIWLTRLNPYFKKLGYQNLIKIIPTLLTKGNSAQRQRKIYAETQDLHEVVKFNELEFKRGEPIWF